MYTGNKIETDEEFNNRIITFLEELIVEANEGKIKAIGIARVCDDGLVLINHKHAANDHFALIGAIEYLKKQIME